jgi:hypothetical protein
MLIFHSYFSLPEGKCFWKDEFLHPFLGTVRTSRSSYIWSEVPCIAQEINRSRKVNIANCVQCKHHVGLKLWLLTVKCSETFTWYCWMHIQNSDHGHTKHVEDSKEFSFCGASDDSWKRLDQKLHTQKNTVNDMFNIFQQHGVCDS